MQSFLVELVAVYPMMRITLLLILLFRCRPIDTFQGHIKNVVKFQPCSVTTTAIEEKVETDCTFRSPEMKVFIEDTDAYGIMYNGNYLRSYDRALHLCTSPLVNSNNDEATRGRVTTQDEDWSIVSMGKQSFVSAASLGGVFVVQGSLRDSSEDLEVWDLKMTSPDGDTVFNIVEDLKISKKSDERSENIFSLPHIEHFSFDEDESVVKGTSYTFPVHRDEIDAHWQGHLPLRNVLNYFERARSNAIGGPDSLQRLQMEDDILVVVASIGDCSLIDENKIVCPGESVSVETSYVVKRRGMIIECYQTLKGDNGSRLAQGKVTLMLIKNSTRRPTSKMPDWVKQTMGLV